MCPACLTTLVITVASTTGAGAAVTAFAVRALRSSTEAQEPETPTEEDCDEHDTTNRHA
jgi:hypothetical protein